MKHMSCIDKASPSWHPSSAGELPPRETTDTRPPSTHSDLRRPVGGHVCKRFMKVKSTQDATGIRII